MSNMNFMIYGMRTYHYVINSSALIQREELMLCMVLAVSESTIDSL